MIRSPSLMRAAFAQLRSLTRLALSFWEEDTYTLADVVGALVPLTGLAELRYQLLPRRCCVPAALGQLKGLRSWGCTGLDPCVLEAGCLDLPNLMSLHFHDCEIADAEMLPGISALQSLTRIEFWLWRWAALFNPQLVQLPKLQHLVFNTSDSHYSDPVLGLFRLPADMGSLRLGLLHLDISGHRLTRFPLALTQLVALECLKADENGFAKLPAGITALSRLTELTLGRDDFSSDPCRQRPTGCARAGRPVCLPGALQAELRFCEVCVVRLDAGRRAAPQASQGCSRLRHIPRLSAGADGAAAGPSAEATGAGQSASIVIVVSNRRP